MLPERPRGGALGNMGTGEPPALVRDLTLPAVPVPRRRRCAGCETEGVSVHVRSGAEEMVHPSCASRHPLLRTFFFPTSQPYKMAQPARSYSQRGVLSLPPPQSSWASPRPSGRISRLLHSMTDHREGASSSQVTARDCTGSVGDPTRKALALCVSSQASARSIAGWCAP